MASPHISENTEMPFHEAASALEYYSLFSQHPNPLFIFSLIDFKILEVNNAAIEKYGYSYDEFLALNIFDIRPAEDRPELTRIIKEAGKQTELPPQWRHQKKNGEIMYVEVAFRPVNWKSAEAYVISVNDVTELKRTEMRLREAEELYRHVIENTGDFIYTTDINGYFRDVNESALKVSGYTLEELQGYRYLDLIAPEFRKKIMLQYTRQFLKKERSLHVEFPFIVKTGEIKWFGQYSTLIFKDSEPTGFHVIGYDITSRKIAEEELNKANIALEKRVEERTKELERTLERLQTALLREKELSELKSRFVAMISHEFRTPLTSILSSTEILHRYEAGMTLDKKERMYSVIINSVHHMTHLLEDVLEFGRSDRAELPFHPQPYSPEFLFKGIIKHFQSQYADRTIMLSFSGYEGDVSFDRKLVHVIVTNLLSNALKYSQLPVEVALSVEENIMRFTVSDHGIGMNTEELQYLFEPFYRGKKVETITGTGLGLSIVKQSVERHKGTISIQSEVGKGTQVTITIPLP